MANTSGFSWFNAAELRRRRLAVPYSRKTLAEAVGVREPAVYLWETDQCLPRPDAVVRLAEIFDCSPYDFILCGCKEERNEEAA